MRRPEANEAVPDGYVLVDKPARRTSFDVVASVRRSLSIAKVGHGGTLDPPATGLLVVALGRSTRLLRFVTGMDKAYEGEVVFGQATDTLDDTGSVTATFDMDDITLEDVRSAASSFVGEIEQVPPMVSALKVGGKRLHELARAGIEVDHAPRPICVARFDVAATAQANVFSVRVECSSGTYVRSLAADLGTALRGGAHLRALRRTRVGPFHIEDATELSAITRSSIKDATGLVAHLPSFVCNEELARDVTYGRVLAGTDVGGLAGHVVLRDLAGRLLAIYEPYGADAMKPSVVFVTPEGSAVADIVPAKEPEVAE